MSLTHRQFEVLVTIERHQEKKHTQRKLATTLNVSLGVINKIIGELLENELIVQKETSRFEVTLKGYQWLEPYKVKKAVLLAAGFGSRLVPITLNTPKPLIHVNGKRLIDSLLDALLAAGITDITIVRGYLGDQFDVLLKKYPMLKFIDNPLFNETNNISSAYLSRDLFEGAYIMEADLIVYHPELIRKYEYHTNYLAMPVKKTDDWCFEVKNHIITHVKVGGENCYHMYGISYWNEKDGKQMLLDLDTSYHAPGGKECYWDVVAINHFPNHYNIYVREVKPNEIIEIDTFTELTQLDPVYAIGK